MTLPPELMDKILEHVSADQWRGRQTLTACALVATWWTGPSQRRLFSSVEINQWNYQGWMDGVVYSASKNHLLEYVRSFSHGNRNMRTKYQMRDFPRACWEYSSALRNLQSLAFFNTRIERIGKDMFHTCFSAFRETLACLSLNTIATSFSAFVDLVDYFPNITTLQLCSFALKPEEGPVPPLSRPLRGKLEVNYLRTGTSGFAFLNQFAELDLEYEELVVDASSLSIYAEAMFLESVLRISAGTIKFLRLTEELRCE